jgi:hypothetical protein
MRGAMKEWQWGAQITNASTFIVVHMVSDGAAPGYDLHHGNATS